MSLKDKYFIQKLSRYSAKKVLDEYHYLHEQGFNFRSGINFGLFTAENKLLIGVAVFHTNSAKEIVKGCFGINSYKLEGFYELGRLVLNPHFYEKNLTSFFLGNAIKIFRKHKNVRALLTYADSDYHHGYIYQACNFKYYGLTDKKNDFWIDNKDGTTTKLQRGKCKHLDGKWIPKSQKHRYLLIFDNELKPLWTELPYPKGNQIAHMNADITEKEDHSFMPIETAQQSLF